MTVINAACTVHPLAHHYGRREMRMQTATVEIAAFRQYDASVPWLLTVFITTKHAATSAGAYPQAYAVMDDFGTLVIVGGWL